MTTLFAVTPPSATAQSDKVSPLVTTEWLAANRRRPDVVVVVAAMDESQFARGHISGARFLRYEDFAVRRDGLETEIVDLETLDGLLEAVGVSDNSHIVVSGPNMMAARLFYTLEYAGLRRVSILDGGLRKWRAEGQPVDSGPPPNVARGSVTLRANAFARISADELRPLVGRSGYALFDTRDQGEYDGTADRRGNPSYGHLEGARRLQWQATMETAGEFHLKDRAIVERMWAERMAPGDTVIAYCWVGMRASVPYVISRVLGVPVRMYDGSDEDWQRRGLPLSKVATPLREVP